MRKKVWSGDALTPRGSSWEQQPTMTDYVEDIVPEENELLTLSLTHCRKPALEERRQAYTRSAPYWVPPHLASENRITFAPPSAGYSPLD